MIVLHTYMYIGLNKHFHMVCIQHKLQQSTGLFVSTKQIWEHLRSLYEIDSLVILLDHCSQCCKHDVLYSRSLDHPDFR